MIGSSGHRAVFAFASRSSEAVQSHLDLPRHPLWRTDFHEDYYLTLITLLRNSLHKKAAKATVFGLQLQTSAHRTRCLDAARDMIRHIHRTFELAPGLRRWSYYCCYCLQAILILLPELVEDNHQPHHGHVIDHPQTTLNKDKASQKCADVVRQFLGKWSRSTMNTYSNEHNTCCAIDDETAETTQQVPPPMWPEVVHPPSARSWTPDLATATNITDTMDGNMHVNIEQGDDQDPASFTGDCNLTPPFIS